MCLLEIIIHCDYPLCRPQTESVYLMSVRHKWWRQRKLYHSSFVLCQKASDQLGLLYALRTWLPFSPLIHTMFFFVLRNRTRETDKPHKVKDVNLTLVTLFDVFVVEQNQITKPNYNRLEVREREGAVLISILILVAAVASLAYWYWYKPCDISVMIDFLADYASTGWLYRAGISAWFKLLSWNWMAIKLLFNSKYWHVIGSTPNATNVLILIAWVKGNPFRTEHKTYSNYRGCHYMYLRTFPLFTH